MKYTLKEGISSRYESKIKDGISILSNNITGAIFTTPGKIGDCIIKAFRDKLTLNLRCCNLDELLTVAQTIDSELNQMDVEEFLEKLVKEGFIKSC